MESGYNNHRANGGVVGRKVGYRESDDAMKEEYKPDINESVNEWLELYQKHMKKGGEEEK